MDLQLYINFYINWNKAFQNHFFSNETEEETFLYINRQIIDQIGSENNLGTTDNFLHTVLMKQNERKTFFNELYKLYVGHKMPDWASKKVKCNSLFDFAVAMTDRELCTRIPCAYLNYIVLAVYLASESQGLEERALGSYITNYLKDKIGDNGDRSPLEILFEQLHDDQPSFKNYRLTEQWYVGLLKYQLVLSSKQIERFEVALYRNGVDFDDYTPYETKVYKIIDYVEDDIKELLRRSMQNEAYRKRFSDLIDNFSLEDYRKKHQDADIQRIVGTFVHAIYLGDDNKRLVLLTDIRSFDIDSKDFIVNSESYDSYNGYNPNHVIVNGDDRVSLDRYSLQDDNYSIKTIENDGVIFFKRYNEDYYIETRHLSNNTKTYVAVKNDKKTRTKFEKFIEKAQVSKREINSKIAETILGEGWSLYRVDGFGYQYYKDQLLIEGKNYQINKNQINICGGIIPPGKKNVYLSNALPYFEFPVDIDKDKLEFYINIDNVPQDENEDYQLLIKNNMLIVDIFDVPISCSQDVGISVEYKDSYFSGKIHASFSICGQDVNYHNDHLFKYDKWGKKLSDNTENTYLVGNKVHGVDSVPVAGVATNLGDLREVCEDAFDKFYFVNLLAACCYMNNGKPFTNKLLLKCIRYAATRIHVNFQLEGGFFKEIRNLLVNSGYISPSYEDHEYQAVPPAFIKVPAPVDINPQRGASYMYMLCGCYTWKFISVLFEYCKKNNILVQAKEEYGESLAHSLLPPTLFFNNSFNPADFSKECEIQCGWNEGDFALDLLNMIPIITEYDNVLTPIREGMFNIRLQQPNSEEFPRVRTSLGTRYDNTHIYWIEMDEDRFCDSSVKEVSWMGLYCRYKKNLPMIMASNTGEICLPKTMLMHLPYIVQRAMYVMNNGLPRSVRAFICDNKFTKEPLFSTLKIYNLGTDHNRIGRLTEILTANSPNLIQPIKNGNKFFDANYSVELWTIKDKEKKPTYYIILKNNNGNKAFATLSSVFVLYDGVFQKVEGTANQVFSSIMMAKGEPNLKFLPETCDFPNKNEYEIELLNIK